MSEIFDKKEQEKASEVPAKLGEPEREASKALEGDKEAVVKASVDSTVTNDTKPSDTEREKAEGVTTKSKEEKPREEREEESETVEEVRSEVAHTCRVGTPLRYNTKMKMLN